ncbi:tetratricopeptide repeat protein [Oceanobacillus sp. FSL H7-0719]|uniref:tetratricopeptide repeat protein n=1 Tax=Oceanobacillus sp. FSL H7-0719 TaxID=2954507 RepID=UPI00324C61F9
MKSGDIILFPKWQKLLEEESIAAIKERHFDEALEKLNLLISYQVNNDEVFTGKLICLMELERYEEAQDLCESLLLEKNDNYYQYIHIYLTLLFQTNQYGLLMEIASTELESGKVPESLIAPFKQLYEMSSKMRIDLEIDRSNIYLDSLYDAVNQDNHIEQWRLINKLSKLEMPPSEKAVSLLVNEHVHPLNKSAIFMWIQGKGVTKPVDIHKFGIHIKMIPVDTPALEESAIAKRVYASISNLEQKNPSLFQLVESLFKHYLYVLYPISPPESDAELIAEALVAIGNEYLNITEETFSKSKQKHTRYINEIKTSDMLYSSIIDE